VVLTCLSLSAPQEFGFQIRYEIEHCLVSTIQEQNLCEIMVSYLVFVWFSIIRKLILTHILLSPGQGHMQRLWCRLHTQRRKWCSKANIQKRDTARMQGETSSLRILVFQVSMTIDLCITCALVYFSRITSFRLMRLCQIRSVHPE
jgi:hypothetical protein